MSDAYNVKQLRSLKNQLEEELKKLNESIEKVKAENESLDQKLTQMNKKGSKLAKELVSSLIKQKENNSKRICKYEEGKNRLEERLKSVTQRIECPDPSEYIAEQAKKMVEEFTEHVKKNEWNYGLAITKVFIVKHVEVTKTMKNLSWSEPTGEVEIDGFESDNQKRILVSKDFPYTHMMLFTQKESDDKVTYTQWFINYLKAFKKEIFKAFKEQFNHESFKLTVNVKNNSFTLELV